MKKLIFLLFFINVLFTFAVGIAAINTSTARLVTVSEELMHATQSSLKQILGVVGAVAKVNALKWPDEADRNAMTTLISEVKPKPPEVITEK